MQLRQELDELYAGFCDTLPLDLRACARQLPFRLGLAPVPETPWSGVFAHEVTFAAPALFAEAMPKMDPAKVRDAVLAHALAVIDAFGTDRVEDSQVSPSAEIFELLAHVRTARDEALAVVLGHRGDESSGFSAAQVRMLAAVRAERRALTEFEHADFARYEQIAAGKTAIGAPASVALARAARWSDAECRAVARTLESVWLGMQYHDDVVDWEDDWQRGNAWAILLAGGIGPRERDDDRDSLRDRVLRSGILSRMLERSRRHFRAARKRAEVLEARELVIWAAAKERHAGLLARSEERSAGYAQRMHALTPWFAEILS